MNAEAMTRLRSAVELTGAAYAVDGRQILHPLTLNLSEQRIGIIGRNGCGKTTFARMISGLIEPSAGQVHVAGIDVASDRKAAIGAVGILFQNPDHQIIFPTVEEELAFGLSQMGNTNDDARQGAHDILARFGRTEWAERSVHTLSQGQRHLVCLMAVLAMGPRTLILDEPFAGLDIPTTRSLFAELQQLEPQVLLITHIPKSLESFDRVLWLEQGRIVGDGSPDEVIPAYEAAMAEEGMDDLAHVAD